MNKYIADTKPTNVSSYFHDQSIANSLPAVLGKTRRTE